MALRPLYKEFALTIFDSSLKLNYGTRTVNIFSDILWFVIHLDSETHGALEEVQNFLYSTYTKTQEDRNIVDQMLLNLKELSTKPLKGSWMGKFHQYFKEFLTDFVQKVVAKDQDKINQIVEMNDAAAMNN